MSPVFGFQSVLGRELSLRLQHELRESTLSESVDNAHAETRRIAVERIERDESLVGLGRIVVAKLLQVVLAEIAVNAVLVGAIPEVGVIVADGVRSTEVVEAQADDSISIGNAAFVLLLVRLVEVVTRRHLVVEQGHVLVQRLFVELLLVERPAEFVESKLVVRRLGPQGDDCRIGILGVAILFARK